MENASDGEEEDAFSPPSHRREGSGEEGREEEGEGEVEFGGMDFSGFPNSLKDSQALERADLNKNKPSDSSDIENTIESAFPKTFSGSRKPPGDPMILDQKEGEDGNNSGRAAIGSTQPLDVSGTVAPDGMEVSLDPDDIDSELVGDIVAD